MTYASQIGVENELLNVFHSRHELIETTEADFVINIPNYFHNQNIGTLRSCWDIRLTAKIEPFLAAKQGQMLVMNFD